MFDTAVSGAIVSPAVTVIAKNVVASMRLVRDGVQNSPVAGYYSLTMSWTRGAGGISRPVVTQRPNTFRAIDPCDTSVASVRNQSTTGSLLTMQLGVGAR